MTDISDSTWKELDADNTSNPPAGLPPGTESGKLYPTIHAMMGANKRNYTQSNPVYTSTGTADLRVYNLNFAGGIQTPAPIGKTIKFNPNFSNVAGIHTLNINGQVYSLKRANGTSDLIAGDIQAGYPVEIVCLAAGVFSHQNSRNIDDNRLPATQLGKSFTSTVRVTASTPLILNDNGTTLSFARNQENSIDIEAFQTSDQSIKNRIDLNRSGGVVTVGGSRVLTLADTGIGKGLDADKLDGQEGSFYLSRANHTGTQPVSTITGLDTALNVKVSKAGDTMTGNLQVGTNNNSVVLRTDGNMYGGSLLQLASGAGQATGVRLKSPSGQPAFMDFTPNGVNADYYWRVVSQADGHFDYIKDGALAVRMNGNNIWTAASGWLTDGFARRGAECVHNSGVWEFGSIDPNYNDRLADAPYPYVLVGLSGRRGTNVISLRAITLRNQ